MSAHWTAPLPTLIWGLWSQASGVGLGISVGAVRVRRGAQPYRAQRGDTVEAHRDWLPKNAAHCITSYPVGPCWSVPSFRMLAVRKPRGRDPSTKRVCVCRPKGGTVTIHPALTAATAAAL